MRTVEPSYRFGIDRFLSVRSARGPSFSARSGFLTFLTEVTGVAQLWRTALDGGWPEQLTFSGEAVRLAAASPCGPDIVFAMDRGGDERSQLYLLHGVDARDDCFDGWTVNALTDEASAVHEFGGWSNDGRQIAFSANREERGRFDVHVQRIDGGEATRVARGPGGFFFAAGWSPDDSSLIAWEFASSVEQRLFVVNLVDGGARLVSPADEAETQYLSPCWSADSRAIYCATTAGGLDIAAPARIDVVTGGVTFFERAAHETEAIVASPGGRWAAWLLNVAGRSELRLADLHHGSIVSPADMPLGVASELVFSRDDDRLAFVVDDPRGGSDVWLWPLAPEQGTERAPLRRVTHSGRAGLPPAALAEPQLVAYRAFDGLSIPAWFWRPAKPAPGAPVIVVAHGGPEGQSRPGFSPFFAYLTHRGYAVLAPNVRGSGGYGTAFKRLDDTTRRMDSVADLAHAAYWLRDRELADPRRIAVLGASYGGFMALAAIVNYPELWAAAVSLAGIANFVTYLENTAAYRRKEREAEYGSLDVHRDFLTEISPISHVERIACPLMLIHGANDPRVPIEETEQIVAALRRRDHPVEFVRYDDEGHGLTKHANQVDAYSRIADFLAVALA